MDRAGSLLQRRIIRDVVVSVVVNVVLPMLIYRILEHRMSELDALLIATACPVLETVFVLLRHRRADVFGLFMTAAFAFSILLVLLGGSPRLVLVKESLLSGVLGLVMLGSLLFQRPLLFYFARHFMAGNDKQQIAVFSSRWQFARFRRLMYSLTIGWGLGMVAEATVRVYLAFHMAVLQFMAVSGLILYGTLALIVMWTVVYSRRTARHIRQGRA